MTASTGGRILVAGIGNIFLGDDGFGPAVVSCIPRTDLPPNVTIRDFGIRGLHLAYELIDGYAEVILVDTVHLDDPPGTVYLIEPELGDFGVSGVMDAHEMDPTAMLGFVEDMGGHVERLRLVGLEPERMEEEIGLSDTAQAAIPLAVEMIWNEIMDFTRRQTAHAGRE